MGNVFSANLNVFTCDEVSVLQNKVISWTWLSAGENREDHLARLESESVHNLRRFTNGKEVARQYVQGKECFKSSQRIMLFYPVSWVIRSVSKSDRVLLGYPLEGVDRVLWFVTFLSAILLSKPIYLYSETWMFDGPARTAYYLLVVRRAHTVLFPGKVHGVFHRRIGIQQERLRHIPSIYSPPPEPNSLINNLRRSHKKEWTLLYVGRVTPLKGLDRLLNIMDSLVRQGYPVRLFVQTGKPQQYMGKDPNFQRECIMRAKEMLGSRVVIMEPTEDMKEVYYGCDVLVMPNRVVDDLVPLEAWGRVVEEALTLGIPVVSTNSVAASLEFIRNGTNGFVVPWQSDDLLSASIVSCFVGE